MIPTINIRKPVRRLRNRILCRFLNSRVVLYQRAGRAIVLPSHRLEAFSLFFSRSFVKVNGRLHTSTPTVGRERQRERKRDFGVAKPCNGFFFTGDFFFWLTKKKLVLGVCDIFARNPGLEHPPPIASGTLDVWPRVWNMTHTPTGGLVQLSLLRPSDVVLGSPIIRPARGLEGLEMHKGHVLRSKMSGHGFHRIVCHGVDHEPVNIGLVINVTETPEMLNRPLLDRNHVAVAAPWQHICRVNIQLPDKLRLVKDLGPGWIPLVILVPPQEALHQKLPLLFRLK